MKIKRKIAMILCLAMCMLAFSGCGSNEKKTVSPEWGSIEQTVEDTGLVVFDDTYSVTSSVSAKILESYFEEGDAVEKGQILYMLDSKDISDQITQANINLEKANEIYRQNKDAFDDLTVKSYAKGLVTKVYCHVGDYVTTGSRIADVVDSETLTIEVPFNIVPGSVLIGESAQIIMNEDGSVINGHVTKVYDGSLPLDGRQYGVNVEITLTNPGALRQGDVAFAKIGDLSSVTEGQLKNKTEQSVYATQSGQVQSLNISEGDSVYSGDVVMVIKNDALKSAVNTAALNIKDIKNTISQLNTKLADYSIVAPWEGVVTEKTAKESDFASPGMPLAVVSDNGRLFIEMDVDEMYIADIKAGQKTEAYIQGENNLLYEGKVEKIADHGIEKNGVTYYTVKIQLENQEELMEAMNMDVKIIINSKDNIMKIPAEAVWDNKVRVLEDGEEVEKEIEIGIKNKKYVEVISGISETDKIIIGGKE